MVADALSRNAVLSLLEVVPTLLERIASNQRVDKNLVAIIKKVEEGQCVDFVIDDHGVLRMNGRICVPDINGLKQEVLSECHRSRLSIHPGITKMYRDMKRMFWWKCMKKDISVFVSKCASCQQIKGDQQKTAGLLQPLEIPKWKWEMVSMDFIDGLPRTRKGNEGVWVIVDRLTKSAHFIPVKPTRTAATLVETFMREIVRLHGIPISIVSDRDPIFTSKFWEALQTSLGIKLSLSTAYHP